MSDRDDLIARAKENATGPERDDEWGDKIDTLEDTDDLFVGRYRGEAEDENYDGHGRRVHLFWNDRGRAGLVPRQVGAQPRDGPAEAERRRPDRDRRR